MNLKVKNVIIQKIKQSRSRTRKQTKIAFQRNALPRNALPRNALPRNALPRNNYFFDSRRSHAAF